MIGLKNSQTDVKIKDEKRKKKNNRSTKTSSYLKGYILKYKFYVMLF